MAMWFILDVWETSLLSHLYLEHWHWVWWIVVYRSFQIVPCQYTLLLSHNPVAIYHVNIKTAILTEKEKNVCIIEGRIYEKDLVVSYTSLNVSNFIQPVYFLWLVNTVGYIVMLHKYFTDFSIYMLMREHLHRTCFHPWLPACNTGWKSGAWFLYREGSQT